MCRTEENYFLTVLPDITQHMENLPEYLQIFSCKSSKLSPQVFSAFSDEGKQNKNSNSDISI